MKGLSVEAKVLGFISEVKVTQRLINNTKAPIEAVFTFQQESCGRDVSDEATINGVCKSKGEAKDTILSSHIKLIFKYYNFFLFCCF